MTRDLLIRGMLGGIFAALLVTLFARVIAEPQVDRAIAYESAHEAREAQGKGMAIAPEPEPVSRDTQKGIGLLVAVTLYGAAVGGIFSLVFAFTYGRIGALGPRSLALLLALAALIAIAIVPALKYPPTPPAVGRHETVALRTAAYFLMIALSIVTLIVAVKIGRALTSRIGAFNAMLVAGAIYVLLLAITQIGLPVIDEVPADFPAVVLWQFRVDAIAMQIILWLTIGLGFGAMAQRVLRRHASPPMMRRCD